MQIIFLKVLTFLSKQEIRLETKISTILPYKHTINVKGSSIKVELDVTDEQLAKVETVINDTLKSVKNI